MSSSQDELFAELDKIFLQGNQQLEAPALVPGMEDDPVLRDMGAALGLGQPAASPSESPSGDLSAGFSAGVKQAQGLGLAAGALLQDAFGAKSAAQRTMREAQKYLTEVGDLDLDRVASPSDISTEGVLPFLADTADFLQYNVAKQVPNIAIMATSALLTQGGAVAAMPVLMRGAATQLTKQQLKNIGLKAAATGAVTGASALEAGGIGAEIEASTGEIRPDIALPFGAAAGALETVTPFMLAKALGVGKPFQKAFMKRLAASNMARKALGFGAIGAGSEFATELSQELIAMAAMDVADEHFNFLGPENAQRLLDAAITGGAVGGVFGAGAGVFVRPEEVAPNPKTGLDPETESILEEAFFGNSQLHPKMQGEQINLEQAQTAAWNARHLAEARQRITEFNRKHGIRAPTVEEARKYMALEPEPNTPIKSRLPTITILNAEGVLSAADPYAQPVTGARSEELTLLFARETPPERRTPAQRFLVKEAEIAEARARENTPVNIIFAGPIQKRDRIQGFEETDLISTPEEAAQGVAVEAPSQGDVVIPAGKTAPVQATASYGENAKAIREAEPPVNEFDSNSRLSPKEQELLAFLQEREQVEGLNAQQYEKLEYLLSKEAGELDVERSAAPELMQEIEQDIDRQFREKPDVFSAIVDLGGKILESRVMDPLRREARSINRFLNFQRFFGDWTDTTPGVHSAVVDPQGLPRAMFHYSRYDAPENNLGFDEFNVDTELGAHFGAPVHAQARSTVGKLMSSPKVGYTIPVYLNIRNPLRLNDPGEWRLSELWKPLVAKGVATDNEMADISAAVNDDFTKGRIDLSEVPRREAMHLKALLKSKGYDGIVYRNRYELPFPSAFPLSTQLNKFLSDPNISDADIFRQIDFEKNQLSPTDSRVKQFDLILDAFSEDSFIAFDKNQIKSALGNNGNFDPNVNKITGSIADPEELPELGMAAEAVGYIINDIALPRGPNVVVVQSAMQLPRGRLRTLGMNSGTKALYATDTQTAYFIADRLSGPADVVTRYLHEAVGHHGLRAVLPQDELEEFLALVERSFPGDLRELTTIYTDLDYSNFDDRLVLAEEKIAHVAERNPRHKIFDDIVAIIRKFIRRIFPQLKLNDAELRVVVRDIRKFLMAPINVNEQAQKDPRTQFILRSIAQEKIRGFTTRVLDKLPKRDRITVENVLQAVKESKAKNVEVEVIQEALSEMAERSFLRADFEKAVRKRLLPMRMSWSKALSEVGVQIPDEGSPGAKTFKTSTLIFTSPKFSSWTTSLDNHFGVSNYISHARAFADADRYPNILNIVEVQSDLFQGWKGGKVKPFLQQRSTEYVAPESMTDDELYEISDDPNSIELFRAKTVGEVASNDTAKKLLTERATQSVRQSSTWARRTVREILMRVANGEFERMGVNSNGKVRLATINTAANIANVTTLRTVDYGKDGTRLEEYIPQQWGPKRMYEDLEAMARTEGAKLVTDDKGRTWWEFQVKPEHRYVKVFASMTENGAQKMQRAGLQVSDETVGSIERFKAVMGVRMAGMFLTPLQMVRTYALEPYQRYMKHVESWWRTKMDIIADYDAITVEWTGDKARADAIGAALFEASEKSDQLERKLLQVEEEAILRQYGVDKFAGGLELYQKIKDSFGRLLDRLERGLKYNAAVESLGDAAKARQVVDAWNSSNTAQRTQMIIDDAEQTGTQKFRLFPRMQKIEEEMAALRNRNYFPRKRFGQYAVSVIAKEEMRYDGKTFKDGDLVIFETRESRKEQKQLVEDMTKDPRLAGTSVKMTKLSDQEYQFIGMPPSLFDALEGVLNLDNVQKEALKDFIVKHSPGRAFLRHLIKRKGVAGFSTDAIRTYASYGMAAANHIARIEHYYDMGLALKDSKQIKGPVNGRVMDSTAVNMLAEYFNQHYQYIMNPEADWAQLRAFGFMWYLGFNVKSAIVNTTQIPMILYPYLAERYGDVKSVQAISTALYDAARLFTGKAQISDALNRMIERGKKEGFIDESLATELAGFTESTVLERFLPVTKEARLFSQVSYYSAWMFRHAEKYTRTAAFIAAVRLAEQQGTLNEEQIFQAGKDAVQATMFEYSKFNRPVFMRGKKSVFFLFWQWLQHASYLASGGHGSGTAVRFWLILLVAGGLQGLPFAENIMDLLNFMSPKIRGLLGLPEEYKDPRVSIREAVVKADLPEFLEGLQERPDLIMHGLSRYYGLGPLHALTALGVPVPNVDVSGSVSMGSLLPGLADLTSQERLPDAKLGRAVVDAMGPVAGIPYNLWKALESNDPDVWKKWERAMPVALKSLSKATRLATRGEETFRGAGSIAKFDLQDTAHRSELIAQSFGFAPTRLNQANQLIGVKEDMRRFYMTKRTLLLESLAFTQGRPEQKDIWQAIHRFNKSLPQGGARLMITPKVVRESLKQRARVGALRTQGLPTERALVPAYRNLEQAFPEARE